MGRLLYATLVLTALSIAHTVDHLIAHPPDTLGTIPGYVGFATLAGLLYLILRRDERAPMAAVVVGSGTALGLLVIHITPHWWLFSDPYSKLDLPFASWAIVFANMLCGIWLGVLGLHESRLDSTARTA